MDILPATPRADTPAPSCFAPPWDRRSPQWLALDARLPHDHLARRLARLAALLDLSALPACYRGTGSRPHRPDLLLLVALYEVSLGRNSPDDWHRAARESEPCRWLAMGCQPSRSRWYAFRDRLEPLLPGLVRQVVRLALAEGLTAARRAALDGTSLAALGSRHRLVNAAALASRLALLEAAVKADAAPPAPPAPGWMARTPSGRRGQLGRYRVAQAALDERRELNSSRRKEDRRPDAKVGVSLSDPRAAYGLDKLKTYRPLYNAQLGVDLDTPLVLAYEAYARPTDAGALSAMLGRLRWFVGRPVPQLLADSKYAAGAELAAAEREGVEVFSPWRPKDPNKPTRGGKARAVPAVLPKEAFTWREQSRTYVCPERQTLKKVGHKRRTCSGEETRDEVYRADRAACAACPRRGECARGRQGRTLARGEYEEQLERLRERMKTDEAKALYRLRGQTVELGFADVLEHRGLRRVPGFGLARARAALGLVVLAHNLRAIGSLLAKKAAASRTKAFPLPTVTP